MSPGQHRGRYVLLSARHQSTNRASPVVELDLGLEPEQVRARVMSASRRGTGLTARSGPYSGSRSLSIDAQQEQSELVQARLPAASDVEDLVGDGQGRGEEVGGGDVVD